MTRGGWTRFAPAPTGYLHLGHVANAIWVWGVAEAVGARVVLRIDDHDRVRSRPEYDAALIEDLAWLGFAADRGPTRQADRRGTGIRGGAGATSGGWTAVRLRMHPLDVRGVGEGERRALVGTGLSRPLPRARARRADVTGAIGAGREAWMDTAVGPCAGDVAPAGDPPIRDRDGNWTYPFSVVVDDLRQDIDHVIRGRDLIHATPTQIRLGRLLGRERQPMFLHHPLIRRPDGRKLSKSSGDTGVREMRDAGQTRDQVLEAAATASSWSVL